MRNAGMAQPALLVSGAPMLRRADAAAPAARGAPLRVSAAFGAAAPHCAAARTRVKRGVATGAANGAVESARLGRAPHAALVAVPAAGVAYELRHAAVAAFALPQI